MPLPISRDRTGPSTDFTTPERDYVRRELDMFFSTLPTVAEGFHLKTWRGGALAGQPKPPPTAKALAERGLTRIDAAIGPPRLYLTEAGLAARRRMVAARRFAGPEKFAHVRRELGIDPPLPGMPTPEASPMIAAALRRPARRPRPDPALARA